MRVTRSVLVGLILMLVAVAPASATVDSRSEGAATTAIVPAPAFTAAELQNSAGADWLTIGGNLSDERYSSLNQITTANAASLKVAWDTHLGLTAKEQALGSAEANAIEYKGTLYLGAVGDRVYALDATTGAVLWKYLPDLGGQLGGTTRGVALGDGRVYIGQNDGRVVALDQLNGGIIWDRKIGNWEEGYTMTSATLYYNGTIIQGVSGGDSGARSYMIAFDAKTGKELWRWYVMPTPGELGSGTNYGQEWQHGGAIWISSSVDPQLGYVYVVTGNPVPWNGRGPGINLWSDSIVALRIATGELVWGFQTVHHDIWDYDVTNPPVLFNETYNGQVQPTLAVASKTGWIYILNRVTGKPSIGIPEKKAPQGGGKYTNLSKTQPYPIGDAFVNQCATKKDWNLKAPDGKPFRTGCIFTPYWPSKNGSYGAVTPAALGGVDWPPSSFNPQTHLMYVCATDGPGGAIGAIPKKQQSLVQGAAYFGVNFSFPKKIVAKFHGGIVAMDMRTNKVAWKADWGIGNNCYSGSLTTAGGLVFAGKNDGTYVAYDAASGSQVWASTPLVGGANAPGMTYMVGGKQYIVLYAGGNGILSLLGKKPKFSDEVVAFAVG
jgi:quinohemoprotein ethanol dehydrogenase